MKSRAAVVTLPTGAQGLVALLREIQFDLRRSAPPNAIWLAIFLAPVPIDLGQWFVV
jgi:hypothetical protein